MSARAPCSDSGRDILRPVAASVARQLGAMLLTAALERRPEVGFKSYDRLFPSQDTLPKGGLGNLIALPLQRQPRDFGNSVFVDDDLNPFDDQWAHLSSLTRMSGAAVRELVGEAEAHGRVLGVRVPALEAEADEPWKMSPSRRTPDAPIAGPLPARVKGVLADELYIDRSALPALLVTRLLRLAAFQNPEFYRAQAMRLPTYDKPRIICCGSVEVHHVVLPRGCVEDATDLLAADGIHLELQDQRERGAEVRVRFLGA